MSLYIRLRPLKTNKDLCFSQSVKYISSAAACRINNHDRLAAVDYRADMGNTSTRNHISFAEEGRPIVYGQVGPTDDVAPVARAIKTTRLLLYLIYILFLATWYP